MANQWDELELPTPPQISRADAVARCRNLPDSAAIDALVEGHIWLARKLASEAAARFYLDIQDATTEAELYLCEEVPLLAIDSTNPTARLWSRIEDRLEAYGKKTRRRAKSFEKSPIENGHVDDETLIEKLTAAKPRKRVDAPKRGYVPIDAAEREKFEQTQAVELSKKNDKLRLRAEKPIKPRSKHAMPTDTASGNFELYRQLIQDLASDDLDRTILALRARGKSWQTIRDETGRPISTLKSRLKKMDERATALCILPERRSATASKTS